jgi:chemotaxis protein CheY-P-specific phosphatase CheC
MAKISPDAADALRTVAAPNETVAGEVLPPKVPPPPLAPAPPRTENTDVASAPPPDSLPLKALVQKKSSGMFSFANTEAIKDKVRKAKKAPNVYNVHDFYHKSGCFQWLATHQYFENTTLGVIVVNALWISVDTDGNTADTILDASPVYVTADILFFAYFSFELVVRFLAFNGKCHCMKDGWFVFDTTLVTLYAFDPFTIGLMAFMSGGGGLNLPTAVLRLFRLARLSRLVRMLRSLPELMVMIKGMVTAATSVGYTLGLLLLITYVFAIALRNLVPKAALLEDMDPEESIETIYFSTVPEAMHNLIIFGTFLDALSDFILVVKEQSVPCFILTWVYISLASLTVMNMLIGVLCEVISAVAEEEKESMIVEKVNDKFGQIVQELDSNNDGELTWEEFQQILDYPDALSALESVNVDPESMVDMAEDFFHEDGEPVAVSFDGFMEMVLDLRGGQQATVKDVMGLGKRFNTKFMKVKETMQELSSGMEELNAKMDRLLELQTTT